MIGNSWRQVDGDPGGRWTPTSCLWNREWQTVATITSNVFAPASWKTENKRTKKGKKREVRVTDVPRTASLQKSSRIFRD
jgi:hypothetical protein